MSSIKILQGLLLALVLLTISCSRPAQQPQIGKYLYAYTSGTVTSGTPLKFILAKDPGPHYPIGESLPHSILDISPAVRGNFYRKDERTFEFIPENGFQNGETYRVKLRLGALLDVPANYRYFESEIKIVPLRLSFADGSLYTESGNDSLSYTATLQSSDYMPDAEVEKTVTAELDGKPLPLTWKHQENLHHLTVNNIPQTYTKQSLLFHFDKKYLPEPEHSVIIPAKNSFEVWSVQTNGKDRQSLRITMSQNLDPSQDLTGLVTIKGVPSVRYQTDGNQLYLYFHIPEDTDQLEVTLHKGLKDTEGRSLPEAITRTVVLPSDQPAVKFIGNGIITPADGKVLVPFSAVALKAVDVEIIQVFQQNMNFFLQQNSYNGEDDLMRTARPVFRKKITLNSGENPINLNRWHDFTLNLSDLIQLEKGVIYRIEIRFRRSYTTLECAQNADDTDYNEQDWDGNQYYYNSYYYPDNYRWEDRNDPCTDSYYTGNRFISKNIINTSLGLLAKRGINNRYFVAVNDIATAEPIANCTVDLYDYQNQKIDSAQTDKNGFAYLHTDVQAFIIQARKNNDKAWLKIADGNTLSLSNFDVSGENVQSGLKGFIYGERGVWRPGDPLYISFILEDREKVLPADHPISAQLIDPKGNITETITDPIGEQPIHCFQFHTDEDAPTGYWKCVVNIGGRSFSKTLRIETIKPNRLSIDMVFPNEQIVGKGVSNRNIQVKTRWLNGASTPGRKAITEVRLNSAPYSFKNYSSYAFTDLSENFEPYTATLFDGVTDDQGNFSFNLRPIEVENAPGVLKATFTTRVFEEGADFSISSYTTHYSPYTEYVGIRLPETEDSWYPTNRSVQLSGVVLNPLGEKIKTSTPLHIEIYKLEWSWWWDSRENSAGSYINRTYAKPVYEAEVTSTNGNFTTDFSIPHYGRYGIFVTDKTSGHTAELIAYFGSWADADAQETATMLHITTDKNTYQVGEKVRLRIPSSEGGFAIVSLENGTSFRDIRRLSTSRGTTEFEFEALPGMCPNIYAYVTLIQPQKERDNDHPIRLYGVVNIQVEDAALHLHPEIELPKELRPGEEFTVSISEKEHRAMDYTLAIVDEGLLSITSFRTPQPFPAFYAREALGVKTWDFYDFIFGAYGARLEKAFAVGGDEALTNTQDEKTNRFKPVVLFEGPCHLKKGEKQQHTFQMPEYIGEVRAMVVAATSQGEYGSATASAEVKKPLMISVAIPRLFTPGDVIEVPVTVFAMNEKIKEVEITAETGTGIELVGNSSQSLTFTQKGEKLVWFRLRIRETTGNTSLTFTARSGKEKAQVTENVEIRVPNPPITRIESKLLASGETADFSATLAGADPQSTLEISTIPPLNLGERLDYLIHYPHGCAEQITSAAFPQIALGQLLELNPQQKKDIEINVKTVINRLHLYQTSDGGFAYWPGSPYPSEWVSSYVTNFLLAAGQRGYTVPAGLLQKALNYIQAKANSFHINDYYDETDQAYRLYVLALANKPDMAAMNRMKERKLQNPAAQWMLASAYALCNYPDIARNLVRNAARQVAPYRQTGREFGSDIRDKAIILEAMISMNMQQEAYQMLEQISAVLSSGEWMSTQSIAFALVAATDYVHKFVGSAQDLTASVTSQGKSRKIKIPKTVYQQQLPVVAGKTSVVVKNEGPATLYTRLITSVAPFGIVTQSEMSGLWMSIKYFNAAGKPVNIKNLQPGSDLYAEISVKNTGITGTYHNLALTYMVPSGFEIINDRLTGNTTALAEADYADIRDDRYHVYFSLDQNQTKVFRFRFNAAFPGEYICPAIRCSAMYDNHIQALLPGEKVEIKYEKPNAR